MSDGTQLSTVIREGAALAVVEGMGVSTVAAAYGVDRKTVSRWVAKYVNFGRDALDRKEGAPPTLATAGEFADTIQRVVPAPDSTSASAHRK